MQSSSQQQRVSAQRIFVNQSDESIVTILQQIFEDRFIYSNEQLRRLIEKNSKGFVKISQLMKIKIVQPKIGRNGFIQSNLQQICNSVNIYSKKLICRNQCIRRIQPFTNKFKTGKILPTFIENFPKQITHDQFFQLLNEITPVYQLYLDDCGKWCFAFSEDPERLRRRLEEYHKLKDWENLRIMDVRQSIQNYQTYNKLFNQVLLTNIYQNKQPFMTVQKIMYSPDHSLQPQKVEQGRNPMQNKQMTSEYLLTPPYKSHRQQRMCGFQYAAKSRQQQQLRKQQQKLQNMRKYNNSFLFISMKNNETQNINMQQQFPDDHTT